MRALRAYASYPSLTRALLTYAPYPLLIHACAPTHLRVFTLTNSAMRAFFLSCVVVSIARYDLRLKNPRKATGPDFIPLKVIKFASNVIDSHLSNIIIKDLEKSKYSEEPKTALVKPIFKKMKETTKVFRPVSILNEMSKIYGKCICNSLFSYAETILIKFHISL